MGWNIRSLAEALAELTGDLYPRIPYKKSLDSSTFPEVFVTLQSAIKMEKQTTALTAVNPHATGIDIDFHT
jgi:hypothetical protein